MEQQIKMNKKSKILLLIFLVFIIVSAFLTYYRTMVLKDYPITQEELSP